MTKSGRATNLCLSGLGSLGTIFSTSLAMGCCAGLLAPVAAVGVAAFPFFGPSFQMPLLYSTIALTVAGLWLRNRRERRSFYLTAGLLGATVLLVPFHTALEVSLFYLLIGLGLSGLLLVAWGPLALGFFYGRP